MSAIVGYIGHPGYRNWRRARAVLHHLLACSAVRGPDATSFAAMPPTVGVHRPLIVAQRPVSANWFVVSTKEWLTLPKCTGVIGHALSSPRHSPENGRNTLAVSRDGNLALVADSMTLDGERLLRAVQQHPHPALGLSVCLRQCRGSFATVVLDRQRQMLWLARTERQPLVLCQLRGIRGYFVCSTAELMLRALERVSEEPVEAMVQTLVPLSPRTVTGISADGRLFALAGRPITRLSAGLASNLFAIP